MTPTEAHRELGQLDNAIQHAAQALALHRKAGNHYGEADALCALAATHRDAGRHTQAIEDAQAALRMGRARAGRTPHTGVSW